MKKKTMQRILYFALTQTGYGIKRSRKQNMEKKEPTHTQTNMQFQLQRPFTLTPLNKLSECRHAQTDLFAPCPTYGFLYSPWNWKVSALSNYYERDEKKQKKT